MRKNIKNFIYFILALLICFNILAWQAVSDLNKPQLLEVIFLDIGQGDAIFIETPQQHQILIDGGPSSKILEKLGKNLPFWDRTIDLVILTHPEKDHLSGLIEVLKRYKIENILWTGIKRDTPEYNEWLKLIKKEGAKIFIAKAGQKIVAQKSIFQILNPSENLEGETIKNSNDTSIVIKLVFGENSFLFTGDISKSVEKKFLNEKVDIDSDVLKVGHHGSKTSSSEDFLAVVSPIISVISSGKNNSYGHPHQEVLDTLGRYGRILRTDLDGDIKIISNGENYAISNL